jgi:hypothetical protein
MATDQIASTTPTDINAQSYPLTNPDRVQDHHHENRLQRKTVQELPSSLGSNAKTSNPPATETEAYGLPMTSAELPLNEDENGYRTGSTIPLKQGSVGLIMSNHHPDTSDTVIEPGLDGAHDVTGTATYHAEKLDNRVQ